MRLAIVTDSSCDLPAGVLEEEKISVVPLYVNIGDKSYLDGVELSRDEFYNHLPEYPAPTTTSAPSPEVFASLYRRLVAEGAEAIISIHIAEALSNIYNAARLGAQSVTEIPIRVIDGGNLSMATGLLARRAAQAAAQGLSMDKVISLLEELIQRTSTFAVLNTFEFLKRSGRVSIMRAGVASMLHVKPILKMTAGKVSQEIVFTRRKGIQRLVELAQSLGELEELSLVHTHAGEQLDVLRDALRPFFPGGKEPLVGEVTPVIGAHIGPGAVGFCAIARA